MRYTKTALLVFGLGMLAGLAVVVGEFSQWERAASALMALGLVLIPLGIFADGHGMVAVRWLAGRLSRSRGKKPSRQRVPASRRKPPSRAVARAAARKPRPRRARR